MTNPETAAARLRTYLRLLPTAHNLGGEIAYSEEFRSEEWPRSCYAPTREDVEALLAAVSVPPPATRADDRAALRDRIRRALCGASGNGFMWDTDMLEPDEYGDVADAVLAVLPEPADRAAVCICGHTETQHFEDVCVTEVTGCDCGDFLTGEAAREMIARWRDAAIQARADRAAILREAADDLATAFGDPMAKHIGALGAAHLRRRAREIEAGQAGEDQPETPLEKRLRYSERRNDELRTECKRRGKRVLEQSEKIRALEREIDEVRSQLGAEILRAGQAEAELRRLADEEQQPAPGPCVAGEQQNETPEATLAAALDGLHTLIATSSRDWGTYRVDAWLWAVLCGWDCEQAEHDETCTHGALEEMQQRHGWSDEAVAKARRYRAAVRALTAPAVVAQPGKEPAAGVRQDGATP